MRKRKKTSFMESAIENTDAYGYYLRYLTEIAVSRFKWHGLPDTIDESYMERTLFFKGSVVFFRDDVLGYLALKNISGAPLSVYDVPLRRTAVASTGYRAMLTENDSVLIYNNMLRLSDYPVAVDFAERLWDIDRTISVNVSAQKTPVILLCDEKQRLTLKNVYKEYVGNEPVIYGSKNLDIEGFKVLKTDAPYVADKLYDTKTRIWNEALTYFGVPNVTYTKRERMLSDEVVSMLGGVNAARNSALNARVAAADAINRVFGLNISVEYNTGTAAYNENGEGGANE